MAKVKMTKKEFERTPTDKRMDAKELKKINKGREGKMKPKAKK